MKLLLRLLFIVNFCWLLLPNRFGNAFVVPPSRRVACNNNKNKNLLLHQQKQFNDKNNDNNIIQLNLYNDSFSSKNDNNNNNKKQNIPNDQQQSQRINNNVMILSQMSINELIQELNRLGISYPRQGKRSQLEQLLLSQQKKLPTTTTTTNSNNNDKVMIPKNNNNVIQKVRTKDLILQLNKLGIPHDPNASFDELQNLLLFKNSSLSSVQNKQQQQQQKLYKTITTSQTTSRNNNNNNHATDKIPFKQLLTELNQRNIRYPVTAKRHDLEVLLHHAKQKEQKQQQQQQMASQSDKKNYKEESPQFPSKFSKVNGSKIDKQGTTTNKKKGININDKNIQYQHDGNNNAISATQQQQQQHPRRSVQQNESIPRSLYLELDLLNISYPPKATLQELEMILQQAKQQALDKSNNQVKRKKVQQELDSLGVSYSATASLAELNHLLLIHQRRRHDQQQDEIKSNISKSKTKTNNNDSINTVDTQNSNNHDDTIHESTLPTYNIQDLSLKEILLRLQQMKVRYSPRATRKELEQLLLDATTTKTTSRVNTTTYYDDDDDDDDVTPSNNSTQMYNSSYYYNNEKEIEAEALQEFRRQERKRQRHKRQQRQQQKSSWGQKAASKAKSSASSLNAKEVFQTVVNKSNTNAKRVVKVGQRASSRLSVAAEQAAKKAKHLADAILSETTNETGKTEDEEKPKIHDAEFEYVTKTVEVITNDANDPVINNLSVDGTKNRAKENTNTKRQKRHDRHKNSGNPTARYNRSQQQEQKQPYIRQPQQETNQKFNSKKHSQPQSTSRNTRYTTRSKNNSRVSPNNTNYNGYKEQPAPRNGASNNNNNRRQNDTKTATSNNIDRPIKDVENPKTPPHRQQRRRRSPQYRPTNSSSSSSSSSSNANYSEPYKPDNSSQYQPSPLFQAVPRKPRPRNTSSRNNNNNDPRPQRKKNNMTSARARIGDDDDVLQRLPPSKIDTPNIKKENTKNKSDHSEKKIYSQYAASQDSSYMENNGEEIYDFGPRDAIDKIGDFLVNTADTILFGSETDSEGSRYETSKTTKQQVSRRNNNHNERFSINNNIESKMKTQHSRHPNKKNHHRRKVHWKDRMEKQLDQLLGSYDENKDYNRWTNQISQQRNYYSNDNDDDDDHYYNIMTKSKKANRSTSSSSIKQQRRLRRQDDYDDHNDYGPFWEDPNNVFSFLFQTRKNKKEWKDPLILLKRTLPKNRHGTGSVVFLLQTFFRVAMLLFGTVTRWASVNNALPQPVVVTMIIATGMSLRPRNRLWGMGLVLLVCRVVGEILNGYVYEYYEDDDEDNNKDDENV